MASDNRTVRDGIVVGFIAYAAVAVFYSAFDLFAARQPLYTVDHLGKAVFRGLRDPAVLLLPSQADMGAIFWYNGLHLVLSVLIGLIVVRLVTQAQQHPSEARAVFAVIVAGFVVTILAVGWLTTPMRPILPWWSIVVANVLASALAGWYLLRKRPGLWQQVSPLTS